MPIHPTAIVSPTAEIAENVTIEAYSIIGPQVTIDSGTVVGPHVVIDGKTTIGENNRIYPFVAIGLPPQDLTYAGEETRVIIGNNNVMRENVTIHRGTSRGEGTTGSAMGSILWPMRISLMIAGLERGIDGQCGDPGRSRGQWASAPCSASSRCSSARADRGIQLHRRIYRGPYGHCPLYAGQGRPTDQTLRRKRHRPQTNGFSEEAVQAIKKCYRVFFRSGLTIKEAVQKVREGIEPLPEVERLIEFVSFSSKRGLAR